MKMILFACAAATMATGTGSAARAADASYIGTWKFAAAVVAPWSDPNRRPDSAESKRLLDKAVLLQPRQIAGPPPFACRAPHYKESDFTPDLLFEGAFDEMQSKNKAVDPVKLAASLGFTGKTIRTLETGCEIDFHFLDAATAEVGLNDYIYTLKKQ